MSQKQKTEVCLALQQVSSFTLSAEINMPTNSLKKLQNVMELQQKEEELGFGLLGFRVK